jgi:cytochrome P450
VTRPYRDIPEPPRDHPLLGHLPAWVGWENATRVLERMLGYAEVCGPLSRVSLGPVKMLVISDAELASAALSDPRANYKGASYVLTRAVLDNVLLLNGQAWESHRALYRKALKNVDAVAAARRVTETTVGRWLEEPGTRRLDRDVLSLVGNIVGSFVAGVPITEGFEPHRHRVQYELAAIGIDLLCQPWTFASPQRWIEMRRSVKEARRFFRRAVDARMHRPDPGARDVLNGFLSLAESGAYPSDPASIQDGVVNFFFTAHDVLASSTAWTLQLLATHPEVQSRLRDVLRDGTPIEAEAELERVVKEGLRLFPGYGLFGRTVQEDMELGGHWIPKGTLLIVSPFVTHRLERYWPRAREFDPDRWKDRPRGTPPAAARDHYLPFGAGARACLASHLAFPIVETVVREVVTRCELSADPGRDPGILYWGTSYPRHGMPITLRPVQRPRPDEARRVA